MSMQLFDTQGNIFEHYGRVGIPKLFDSKSEVSANGLTLRLRQCKLVRSGELVGFLQLRLPIKSKSATQEFLLTMIVMSPFVLLTFGVCSFVVAGIAARPIEELVVALRRFVADAGHELNTPASIVQAESHHVENWEIRFRTGRFGYHCLFSRTNGLYRAGFDASC